MKVLNRKAAGLILVGLYVLICGCVSKPIEQFTKQDFMLIRPFKKTDTIVYLSAIGQVDTIIFSRAEIDTEERRSFELGFYNAYVMGVEYELTHGSYHMEKHITNGHVLYPTIPERFYAVNISTKEYSNKELSFLNLFFDEDYLRKITIDTTSIITFKGNGIGVNSFKFSPQIGVISYVDTSGIEWRRDKK